MKIANKYFKYIAENPYITGAELARDLGIADRTARRWVAHWKAGKLEPKTHTTSFEQFADEIDEENEELWEELMDIATRLNELRNKRNPVLTHVEMQVEGNGPVALIFASCSHLGGRWTNHQEFKRLMLDVLGIDGLYFAPLGDEIEGYIPRFRDSKAVMDQPLNIPLQVMAFGQVMAEMAENNKLLWGVGSQHGTDWSNRIAGSSPVQELYDQYNVPFFIGQAYVKLHVGSQTYNIAVSHEFPGHSMYNKLHPHARAHRFQFPNADVVVQGDKHTYAMAEDTSYVWEADAGNRPSPFVWFVQSGTAKDGPDPYTIKRWSRGVLEWPILIFDDKEHTIEGTRHLRTAKAWLEGVKHRDIVWKALGSSEYVQPWGAQDATLQRYR